MRLLLNGSSLRIAEMGPDFLVVDADQRHDPGDGTVVLRVNASERRWDVFLPQGIVGGGMQEVAMALPVGQTAHEDAEVKEVAGSRSS